MSCHYLMRWLLLSAFVLLIRGKPLAGNAIYLNEISDLRKQLDQLTDRLDAAQETVVTTTTTRPPQSRSDTHKASPSKEDLDLVAHMISRLYRLKGKSRHGTLEPITDGPTQGSNENEVISPDANSQNGDVVSPMKSLSRDKLQQLLTALVSENQRRQMKGDEHVHLHAERDVEGDDGPPLHRAHAPLAHLSVNGMRKLALQQYEGHFGRFEERLVPDEANDAWKDGPVADDQLGAAIYELDEVNKNEKDLTTLASAT